MCAKLDERDRDTCPSPAPLSSESVATMPAATLAFAGAQEGRVAAVHPLVRASSCAACGTRTLTSACSPPHRQALFSVCDSFIRRNEGQERVIGTLLGRCATLRGATGQSARARCDPNAPLTRLPCSVSSDGTVEIKNSYAVPHNESGGQARVGGGWKTLWRPPPLAQLLSHHAPGRPGRRWPWTLSTTARCWTCTAG